MVEPLVWDLFLNLVSLRIFNIILLSWLPNLQITTIIWTAFVIFLTFNRPPKHFGCRFGSLFEIAPLRYALWNAYSWNANGTTSQIMNATFICRVLTVGHLINGSSLIYWIKILGRLCKRLNVQIAGFFRLFLMFNMSSLKNLSAILLDLFQVLLMNCAFERSLFG